MYCDPLHSKDDMSGYARQSVFILFSPQPLLLSLSLNCIRLFYHVPPPHSCAFSIKEPLCPQPSASYVHSLLLAQPPLSSAYFLPASFFLILLCPLLSLPSGFFVHSSFLFSLSVFYLLSGQPPVSSASFILSYFRSLPPFSSVSLLPISLVLSLSFPRPLLVRTRFVNGII